MRSRVPAALGAALFFVLAPGVVAGLVPWLLTGWRAHGAGSLGAVLRVLGVVLVVTGATVLVAAFVRFVAEGRGTPAPVAPTEQLVVGGLYRYVRNPMYLAVLSVILGQALLLGRLVLLVYAAVIAAGFIAFVHWYEEPTLRRRYGSQYEAYRRAVPGWWLRRRPYSP